MTYSAIKLELDAGVATITLNRPDKLNAVTVTLRDELLDALTRVEAEAEIRCLVLQGAGRAFCAGQDLEERAPILAGERIDLGEALEQGFNRIVRCLRALPKPVLCAVRGAAAGAGASLALACDIVVAGRSARFTQSFTRIGLVPDGGSSWHLPRLVGPARAAGLVLLAEPVSGEEAARIGLIWRCVEDEALEATVAAMARQLCSRSSQALALAKQALQAALNNSLETQLDLERDLQRQTGFSEAYRHSVAAFLAKRR